MRVIVVCAVLLATTLAGCSGSDPATEGADAGGPTGSGGDGGTSTATTTDTRTETSTGEPSEERREPVTWVVTMEDAAFQDSPATIQRGDTVRWVHEDGATTHTAETRDGAPESFDSGDMTEATNSEFEFTFETAGDYAYFCRYHEGAMSESIEVREAYEGQPGDAEPGDGSNETGGAGANANQSGEPREPVTWEIEISGTAFVDGSLIVQKGDTVRWVHRDAAVPHTVTADDGTFGSGPAYMVEAPVLDTYEFTFDAAGEFPYHCEVHPSMQQTITVVEVYQPTP